VQVRGTVRLIQNPVYGCQPCQGEGCERHVNSPSACLDELPADRVIAQAIELLERPAGPVPA
jgi:heptosyltransferase-3